MLKKIYAILVAAAIALEALGVSIYPQSFVVKAVIDCPKTDSYDLVLETSTGITYIYNTEDGDWFEGDICSGIVCDMGTASAKDDIIFNLTFSGWVHDDMV